MNYKLPFTIWSLSIPIFIDMILSFSMFFIDNIFLSKISLTAAAAVGAVLPIIIISIMLFMMIAQGGISVSGHFLGAQQLENAKLTYTGTLIINAMLGLILCIVLIFGASKLVSLFGMTNDAENFASTYLSYMSAALFFMALKFSMSVVCMSQGKTQYNIYAGIIVNILNIGFNCLFLYYSSMGIYGVALATILSQCIICLYYLYVVIKKMNHQYDFNKVFKNFKKVVHPILSIGIPAAIQPISTEIGMFVLSLFTIIIGEEAMATRVFVLSFLTVCISWASSMSIGNQIMVSHLYGAKQYFLITKIISIHMRLAMVGSLMIAIILFSFGDKLLMIFTDDPFVISTGLILLSLGIIIEPIRSQVTMLAYSLTATGDAKFPAFFSVFTTWCITIPLGYLLSIKLAIGLPGIWIVLLLDETIRAAVYNSRWLSGKWQVANNQHLH